MTTLKQMAPYYHWVIVCLIVMLGLCTSLAYSIGKSIVRSRYERLITAFGLESKIRMESRDLEESLRLTKQDVETGKCVHSQNIHVTNMDINELRRWVETYTQRAEEMRDAAKAVGIRI